MPWLLASFYELSYINRLRHKPMPIAKQKYEVYCPCSLNADTEGSLVIGIASILFLLC